MGITIFETSKKRKRDQKVYGFNTFADPGSPIDFSGPFRDNIRLFLQECGEIEESNVQGMPTWCTLLVNQNNGVVVPLYIIEESVKHCLRPFCDHCRCIGWSHHFVSKRRYHVIIPVDDEWDKPPNGLVLDHHTHLLHGMIHCNGFGHLLCINGLEGGAKYLRGREIMDLWDRICTTLRTRKITVEDVSRKKSVDLRLLYGAAYGHPWFGRWGYKFFHGSYGVTEHKYETAIEILSSLGLDKIIDDFANTGRHRHIEKIVRIYREMSETKLITIKDLLQFMLALKSQTSSVQRKIILKPTRQQKSPVKDEKPGKYQKFASFTADMASRWPARRLEYAAEVIVDALKEKKLRSKNGRGGMSRQDVRDAARLHIGDTGLLDFVLKSINNFIVGNYIVRRAINPSTRVLEFTIDEIVNAESTLAPAPAPADGPGPGMDVCSDMEYLYQEVLEEYPESGLVGLASRAILDSKHFVKEWPLRDEEDALLRFMCRVMPNSDELETELTRPLPPGELVVVPTHSTVGELKTAVESALRDTYSVMERFVVREVEGMEEMDDGEVLFGALESGAHVWVRGSDVDLWSELKYEGGADNWMVDCSCGARDDDGERMVACDICEVWQHTRCGGIDDTESVPPLFLCSRCGSSLMPSRTEFLMDAEYA